MSDKNEPVPVGTPAPAVCAWCGVELDGSPQIKAGNAVACSETHAALLAPPAPTSEKADTPDLTTLTDSAFLHHLAALVDTDEPWPHWKAIRQRLYALTATAFAASPAPAATPPLGKVRVDHRVPPNTVYLQHGEKIVGAITNLAAPSQPSEPTADTLTQDDADFLAQLSDYSWDRATCVAEDAEVQKEMDLLAMIVVKVRRAASEPSEPTHCGAPNGVFTCDRDAHHEGDHHCQSGDYHHGGVTLHLSWPSEPTAEQMTEAIDHLELLSGRALIADLSGRLSAVTAERDTAISVVVELHLKGNNGVDQCPCAYCVGTRAAPTTEPTNG